MLLSSFFDEKTFNSELNDIINLNRLLGNTADRMAILLENDIGYAGECYDGVEVKLSASRKDTSNVEITGKYKYIVVPPFGLNVSIAESEVDNLLIYRNIGAILFKNRIRNMKVSGGLPEIFLSNEVDIISIVMDKSDIACVVRAYKGNFGVAGNTASKNIICRINSNKPIMQDAYPSDKRYNIEAARIIGEEKGKNIERYQLYEGFSQHGKLAVIGRTAVSGVDINKASKLKKMFIEDTAREIKSTGAELNIIPGLEMPTYEDAFRCRF